MIRNSWDKNIQQYKKIQDSENGPKEVGFASDTWLSSTCQNISDLLKSEKFGLIRKVKDVLKS